MNMFVVIWVFQANKGKLNSPTAIAELDLEGRRRRRRSRKVRKNKFAVYRGKMCIRDRVMGI